ncbi:MAG: tRNA (adenosine(37)-N6)-threonylcarbamoyltransferase complex dimerization subunit type 1 TsaB [Calditrichaeota bacterium]|nr:MAG: tRNA (adenosine(37)-N6)-threonylcarbamoyltransferase complex dimerization subunit type 1 TsaB [Calditrichota bacterium]
MNILGIDCSGSVLSVSLKSGERLFESSIHDGFRHSENLMVQIDHLFKLAGLNSKNLDLIAVAAGPGSFTGLRIAMSTAKGIAVGSKADLISISTLDLYASFYRDFDGAVVPLVDAKKKRFYASIYHKGMKDSTELDVTAEALLERLQKEEKILFTGPDSIFFQEYAEKDSRIIIDFHFPSVTSTSLIEMGITKWQKNGPDPHGSGPVYIRKSEAEISMFGE